MKNKKILVTAATMILAMSASTTAFAATWRAGEAPNQNRWWYDFEDGTCAADGWMWVDGNNDGIAECYGFDKEGWLYTSQTTPDGFVVNENGAWMTDGKVETQAVKAPKNTDQKANTGGTYLTGHYDTNGTWVNKEDIGDTYLKWLDGTYYASEGKGMTADELAAWEAQFKKYGITDDLYKSGNPNELKDETGFTYLVPASNTGAVYDIANSLGMKLFIRTGGMATFDAIATTNADGSETIRFVYNLLG